MIVADTSALVSLSTAGVLDEFLAEFDVQTTETVRTELEATSEYDDVHGRAAADVLDSRHRLAVHENSGSRNDDETESRTFQSSRIDDGEASAALLAREVGADFLVTDDLRVLPELQSMVDARVAISPIVLKALLNRDVLDREEARDRLETVAEHRDWLGAPIYRRAEELLREE